MHVPAAPRAPGGDVPAMPGRMERLDAHAGNAALHAELDRGGRFPELREGAVMPRRSSLLCSRANCAYWQVCEAEYGGCVRE